MKKTRNVYVSIDLIDLFIIFVILGAIFFEDEDQD